MTAGNDKATVVQSEESLPRRQGSVLLIPPALPAAWLLLMIGLGLGWTRGERLLGNDSFFYLELAKAFQTALPDRFGDLWPFGYPLAGSLISRLGMSAHTSLLIVSVASFFFIVVGIFQALPRATRSRPETLVIITATVAAPVCPLLLMGTMSEPMFSAALVGLALSLASWPRRWAMLSSVLMALLAFAVRYAGLFAFGVVGFYAVLRWSDLREQRRIWFLVTVFTASLVLGVALLYTNYLAFGRVLGPHTVGNESILTWPMHLARLGWGPIGAFVSGQLIKKAEVMGEVPVFVVGIAVVALIGWLCVRSWRSPRFPCIRPVVLVVAAYSLSIVTLRATAPFDAVSSPRFFLPVLLPVMLLVVANLPVTTSWSIRLGTCASILLSIALACRGISPQQRADLSSTHACLGRALKTGDTVAVNGFASSLAAYFPNRFFPVAATADGSGPEWHATPQWNPNLTTFTVIAAKPRAQLPGMRQLEENWQPLVNAALRSGRADLMHSNAESIVLRARWLEDDPRPRVASLPNSRIR